MFVQEGIINLKLEKKWKSLRFQLNWYKDDYEEVHKKSE